MKQPPPNHPIPLGGLEGGSFVPPDRGVGVIQPMEAAC